MLVLWRVLLVGEVDEELGISLDGEVLPAERRHGPETGEQALEFRDVVGGLLALLETELYHVVELFLGG